jgi:tight adherence protein B
MSQIQFILVLIVIFLVFGIIALYILNNEAERKKKLMGTIKGQGGSGSGPKESSDVAQNKRRAELARKLKETKEADSEKKKTTISMLIAQAGLSMSTAQFWLLSFVLMIMGGLLAQITGQDGFVVLMASLIGFFGAPRFFLKRMAAKRQKEFLEEFPDALEATVRLLKAGMPVSEAVLMISKEFSGPVGEEMSRIYDKQKIGIPLHEAATEATVRMPLPEMKMFATGLTIQAQTGSSLSEVLLNLAGVIRARFRLKRKIKALSSEAIASASIIGSLPILVATGMYFVNYEYISVLFTTPFGKVLLACAVTWMCLGIFVMKLMINFKV